MNTQSTNTLNNPLLPGDFFADKNGQNYRFRIAEDIVKSANLRSRLAFSNDELVKLYKDTPRATIYVHVPWCVETCTYCYYYGKVEGRSRMQALLNAEMKHADLLDEKIALRSKSISSIYFGGGTPTVLPADMLEAVMERFVGTYAGVGFTESCSEASISSLTKEKIAVLKKYINRISIGVQSFSDSILASVARSFNSDQAKRMLDNLLPEFDAVNIDLIFGLKDQTFNDWRHTIETAVNLGVTSITLYRLEIRVPQMLAEFAANPTAFPTETECQQMRHWAKELLESSGYRENLVGWFVKPKIIDTVVYRERWQKQTPCIAFGPGVHNYAADYFYYNTKNLDSYMAIVGEGKLPIAEFYDFSLKEQFLWYCIAQWKSNAGINLTELNIKFGLTAVEGFLHRLENFAKWGLVLTSQTECSLTEDGKSVIEWIIAELFTFWWKD